LAKKKGSFEVWAFKAGDVKKYGTITQNMKIDASIVLYHNTQEIVEKTIHSFLDTSLDVKLHLIDNSKTDALKVLADCDDRIEYVFNGKNIGFGAAHNIALRKSLKDGVAYHLVLNPDVYFEKEVLDELLKYMEKNQDVANVMPQIYYEDGTIQHQCRMLPTPFELFARRFLPFQSIVKKINKKVELHSFGYDKEFNIPFLHGSFMFLRVCALKEVGLFDENLFLYMEDLDLNRRLYTKYRTMFYPYVNIVHIHAKDSRKRKKELLLHISSTIKYFNKWGWFFDKQREEKNKELFDRIKNL